MVYYVRYLVLTKDEEIVSVFHLPKNSRNSGWDVNGTRVFGSFHWKCSEINGIPVGSPVFLVETSQWKICVSFTDFLSLSPVPCLPQCFKQPGFTWLPRVSTKMVADQGQFSGSSLQTNFQGYYECSACHVGLPNECRCGTLPVAWTTLHRPSIVPLAIQK